MHATWYLLEDGMPADPADVVTDDAGRLRHKSGAAIAYGPHGPRSRGMSLDEIEAARSARAAPPAMDREMKAQPRAKYKTR